MQRFTPALGHQINFVSKGHDLMMYEWLLHWVSHSLTLLDLQESPQCSPCPQSSLVWMPPCPRCPTSRQWMCTCGSAPSLCFCRSLSMQRWITSPQWKSGSNSTGEERYGFALRVSTFQNVAGLVSFLVLWWNTLRKTMSRKEDLFWLTVQGHWPSWWGSEDSKSSRFYCILHPPTRNSKLFKQTIAPFFTYFKGSQPVGHDPLGLNNLFTGII